MKRINIAIDGYSSCGKGTLAKFVAQQLGYVFIDSGAMYRGLTLKLIENKIDISDLPAIEEACKDLFFEFKLNQKKGSYELYLNGQNVEGSIRNLTVSNLVSEVAAISLVRKHLVRVQQAIGKNKGVVMDG
ncbi:(d)CMP kinase, partial [Bacteroidia bacterium]|nr:(d)CMP kinase [Bacteroidia bacterium]